MKSDTLVYNQLIRACLLYVFFLWTCLFTFQMTGATPYFAAAFVGGLFIVVGMVGSIFILRHIKQTRVIVWEALSEYSRSCKDLICDVTGSVRRSLVRAQPVLSSVFYSWTSYSTEKLLFGKSDRIPGLLASQHGGLGIPCSYLGYTKEQTGVKQSVWFLYASDPWF